MKQWSLEEEELLISKLGNTTTKEISKLLGRSVIAVQFRANRMGLRTRLTGNGNPCVFCKNSTARDSGIFSAEEYDKIYLIKYMLLMAKRQVNRIGQPVNINLDAFAASYQEYKTRMNL